MPYYVGKRRNSVVVRKSVETERNYKECSVRYLLYLRKEDVKNIMLSRSDNLRRNF